MRYEPVGYIVEYDIGTPAVFLLIMLRYFGARRFPNQKNRLYSLILWATMADMLLDVVSAKTIDHALSVPLRVTYVANTAFYSTSILMLVLMMLYTLVPVKPLSKKNFRRIFPMFLPGIAVLLLLLSNRATNRFFYVDPTRWSIPRPARSPTKPCRVPERPHRGAGSRAARSREDSQYVPHKRTAGIENGSLLLGRVSRFLRECAEDSWVFRMRGNCFVAITREREDYRVLNARVNQRI